MPRRHRDTMNQHYKNHNNRGDAMKPISMAGAALLVVGLVLLYFGFNASQSPAEELSEALTGRFTEQTMFYFIGGAVAAVLGALMLMRKK